VVVLREKEKTDKETGELQSKVINYIKFKKLTWLNILKLKRDYVSWNLALMRMHQIS